MRPISGFELTALASALRLQPLDTYTGTDGNDTFVGSSNNDTISGLGGDDRLNGALGSDLVDGGTGNDRVIDFDAAADTLIGGDGIDVLEARFAQAVNWVNDPNNTQFVLGNTVSGFETLELGLSNSADILDNSAGAGGDIISAGSGADLVIGGGGLGTEEQIYGEDGNDTLIGGEWAQNYLSAGRGNDSLVGGSQADTLYGSDGSDIMLGGAGNDWINDWTSDKNITDADTMDGGAGFDRIETSFYNLSLSTHWVNDADATVVIHGQTITGFEIIDVVFGRGNDYIDNSKYGKGNSISGSWGNDTVIGGRGKDYLEGGDDHDLVIGNDGNDSLQGWSGNDTLIGGRGNDYMHSEEGRDRLIGGAGDDSLGGSSGSDTYVFDTLVGVDSVSYVQGEDKLVFSQAGIKVGDGDLVVEGRIQVAGPGGFSAAAEVVVVSGDIAGDITKKSAAAAIGSASSAYADGQTALFCVDNGTVASVYYFTSSGADAQVSASELTLVATLSSWQATTANPNDFIFEA